MFMCIYIYIFIYLFIFMYLFKVQKHMDVLDMHMHCTCVYSACSYLRILQKVKTWRLNGEGLLSLGFCLGHKGESLSSSKAEGGLGV